MPVKDPAAEEQYKEVEAGKLVGIYQRMTKVLDEQAKNLETYPSNQYTNANANAMRVTAQTLEHIGRELRTWHDFIWREPAPVVFPRHEKVSPF